jgi:hypothetical protein
MTPSSTTSKEPPSQDLTRELLLFGLALNLPFRWTEHPSTSQLFNRRLGLQLRMPGRTKLRQELDKVFIDTQTMLKAQLATGSKISLAIDCWTSTNHLHFLAVVAYYIDKHWNYHEVLLDAPPIYGQATAERVALHIHNVIKQYGFEDRFLALTSDNGSNLVAARGVLQTKLQGEGIKWEAQEYGIPCLAHVIQLAAKAFCDGLGFSIGHDDEEEGRLPPIAQSSSIRGAVTKVRPVLTLYSNVY